MVHHRDNIRRSPLDGGALGSAAVATTPGTNGRLTFMRQDHDGFWQVWTSNPDLTAEHQLTSGHVNSGWCRLVARCVPDRIR